MPPAEPLLVEILIGPRRTEIRTHEVPDETAATQVIDSKPVEFTGPLADLKRFAHERSRPSLRFYIRERQTQGTPTIRVEVRVGRRRVTRGFATEAEARVFIDSQRSIRPIHDPRR